MRSFWEKMYTKKRLWRQPFLIGQMAPGNFCRKIPDFYSYFFKPDFYSFTKNITLRS